MAERLRIAEGGEGRPAGRTRMWAAEPSSVSKPSASLWNGGSFLVHASGQSRAEHTLSYFWSGPFSSPNYLALVISLSLSLSISPSSLLDFSTIRKGSASVQEHDDD